MFSQFKYSYSLLDRIINQSHCIDSHDSKLLFNKKIVIPRPGLFLSIFNPGHTPIILVLLYVSLLFIPFIYFGLSFAVFLKKPKRRFLNWKSLFFITDYISFEKNKNNISFAFDSCVYFKSIYNIFNRSVFVNNNYLCFLSRFEIFSAYILGTIIITTYMIRNIFSYKVLQIIFSLDFYFLSILKYKLEDSQLSKFYFTDHYCRYAIFFSELNIKEKIQIQHGILSKEFFPYDKIKVSECHVFDDIQMNIFKNNIHLNNCQYYYVKPNIIFNKLLPPKIVVFFISRLDSFLVERELIVFLRNNFQDKISIVIKPHPKMSISRYYDDFYEIHNVILIKEKLYFVDADVVISSNSTMKLEYELYGYYTLAFDDLNLLNKLNIKLNERILSNLH